VPEEFLEAEIFPLFMALWIVALFLPVAVAACESEYFMPLYHCCVPLHLCVVQSVAPLRVDVFWSSQ
jgi:hypothetical protein